MEIRELQQIPYRAALKGSTVSAEHSCCLAPEDETILSVFQKSCNGSHFVSKLKVVVTTFESSKWFGIRLHEGTSSLI